MPDLAVVIFTGKLYGGVDSVDERHRHRYEASPID